MKEWYSVAELSASNLPELPRTEKSLDNFVRNKGWRDNAACARRVAGRTKPFWEYHLSLLPTAAQLRLQLIQQVPPSAESQALTARKKRLWERFERLSRDHKDACRARLASLDAVEVSLSAGMSRTAAVMIAARRAHVSERTIYNWIELTDGCDRDDWLAALAPSFMATSERSICDPRAWQFLTSDYLRPEAPKFSPCYRRMLKAAKKHGWSPIPQERALRRRLEAEVPKAVQTLSRKGGDRAKSLYPAQRRSRAHLHALQMVNMDGHKIDVFVKAPWSALPVRMFLVAIQDLFSGKIIAWRLSDSENKETVRLVIGDVVELYGIFEDIYLDNGRSFASKWITGGTANRYRYRVRDEDPCGLLTTLGVRTHFTTPYSGQSKPIERAFLDLTESIAKHPLCAGAYTGNRPNAKPENYGTRAIALDVFRAHVAREIVDHNAQPGRTAANCAGRSFDQTFGASFDAPGTIIKSASPAQRSLWLLACEAVRAQKGSGEIHFQGNRYWSRELNQHAGKKVVIRFDPDALHGRILVYAINDVLICEAPCIADTGFNDVEAARLHAKRRRDFQKAVIAERDAHRALTAAELADLLHRGETESDRPEPLRPKVARLVTAGRPAAPAISQDEAEDSFARAMAKISASHAAGTPILPFPTAEFAAARDRKGNAPAPIASGSPPKRRAYGSTSKNLETGTSS